MAQWLVFLTFGYKSWLCHNVVFYGNTFKLISLLFALCLVAEMAGLKL